MDCGYLLEPPRVIKIFPMKFSIFAFKNISFYYIPKKLSRSLCIAENIEQIFIFNSLECFPWKLLSYCTGPRNVLSYCTGPRKHVPGGTTFASWSPLKKKCLAAILLFDFN